MRVGARRPAGGARRAVGTKPHRSTTEGGGGAEGRALSRVAGGGGTKNGDPFLLSGPG
jgi:hypothetical protein